MKKLILLITSLFIFSIGFSQITVKADEDYKTYTGVAGDTLNSSYILAKNIYVGQKDYKYLYYIEADADSLGDGTDITAQIRGSMDGSHWSNVGSSITWGVTTSDTTFIFNGLGITESGTESIAAYNVTTDTTGLSGYPADTLAYPTQTITVSKTITNGFAYRYLQVYFFGAGAGADMELEAIRVRIIKL